ncbi:MAG: hypothetical protein H6668_08135 [Ardenticatenaceae bacterium]|nr:hypothetical protein [Ardenticatenaceae bacterium]
MQYQYATSQQSYSDFAGGRVLHTFPGYPAFPVRLVSELFQRALAHWRRINGRLSPITLYDPCCGAAYHLAVLGLLHGRDIGTLIASDIDTNILTLARRNLSLLTPVGMAQRIGEIEQLIAAYDKPSHHEALHSAQRLQQMLPASAISTHHLFTADLFQPALRPSSIDLLFADVPYGMMTQWQVGNSAADYSPIHDLLVHLRPFVTPQTIVVIASNKQQKAAHSAYRRLEHLRAGKRQIFLLQPV